MNVLFFIGDAGWTARARIFTAAAQGLAVRGHEVSVACPPGPVVERLDGRTIGIVRIDPGANAALGTFDFRRVAQERSLDIAFVHTAREQFMTGSGLRFARGGQVLRRLGIFEPRDDEPGLLAARVARASLVVTTNAESATLINAGAEPPVVVPLGVDAKSADGVAPIDRRALHLRDDAIIVACPYAPNGRARLLNVMRVLALLAPRHPRLRAVVHGHRAAEDDIRMQAAALGVAPIMQFVDSTKFDATALLKTSDFAWVAADHDPAALACLDAMATSRAVVAERSRTVEHFVADGINGAVLPDGDTAALAAAVAAVISRTEARAAWGAAGRQRVQRELGLDAMIAGFERAAQVAHDTATT